jgi:hypothetical protein
VTLYKKINNIKNTMYNKLISFDFDSTLFNTPEPHAGKVEWEKKTGIPWAYNGWWGKVESLNPEVFYIHMNEWVYRRYIEAKNDPNAFVILATGRLLKVPKMLETINKMLEQNGLEFDGVYLNWGGETFDFKTKLFSQLMNKLKVKEMTMYDDRHEHIGRFRQWSQDRGEKINIVDIVNKKIYRNYK